MVLYTDDEYERIDTSLDTKLKHIITEHNEKVTELLSKKYNIESNISKFISDDELENKYFDNHRCYFYFTNNINVLYKNRKDIKIYSQSYMDMQVCGKIISTFKNKELLYRLDEMNVVTHTYDSLVKVLTYKIVKYKSDNTKLIYSAISGFLEKNQKITLLLNGKSKEVDRIRASGQIFFKEGDEIYLSNNVFFEKNKSKFKRIIAIHKYVNK